VIPTNTSTSCDSIVASSPDIRCKFSQVRKNNTNGPTLLDGGDLKPYKDNVVMFGNISEDLSCSYPAGANRSYRDFFCTFTDTDADINFNIHVDRINLEAQPGFWTDGWLPVDPSQIRAKMDLNRNDVHCEPIMYGRTGDPCDNGDSGKILLPGWMENGANSILWNGTPVDGNVDIYASGLFPVRIVNQTLPPGTRVRVTGALVLDCGHISCSPVDVSDPAGVEIHPVYSIDILQDWSRPRPNADLTGVWAPSDGATDYVRQLGNTVWWLGLSRDQGRSFANIFHGFIRYDEDSPSKRLIVVGDWADVPMGENGSMNSGQLRLGGSFCFDPATVVGGNGVNIKPLTFKVDLPCDVSGPLPQWNILKTGFTNNGMFGDYRWQKLYDQGWPIPQTVPPSAPSVTIRGDGAITVPLDPGEPSAESAVAEYRIVTQDLRPPLQIVWTASSGSTIENPNGASTRITFDIVGTRSGQTVRKGVVVHVTDADNRTAQSQLGISIRVITQRPREH